MNNVYKFTVLLFFASLFTACLKKDTFPDEPIIEFKEFKRYNTDSADYIINFTDGDGDIGNIKGDTNFYLYLTYQWKDTVSGTYYDTINVSGNSISIVYPFQIPYSTQLSQNPALKGEILVKLRFKYSFANKPVYRYKCYIYDRALNKSNEVYSKDTRY